MVRPERFELPTLWFVARCSIQLSYGRITETISGDFDYSGNSPIHEMKAGRPDDWHTVNTLYPALHIFFLTLSMNFWHHPCLHCASVNLSHRWQFLLGLPMHALCIFR
jgi:hypothetical protein